MENKLKSDWSTELDEYMYVRYGIDISVGIRDEVQKAIQNETQENRDKYFPHVGEEFEFVVHIKEI